MKKYVLPVPALIHVFQSWCTKNADPKKEVEKTIPTETYFPEVERSQRT